MVEESETILKSPSETQEVVEDVNSPFLFASPRYSNIFSFLADNAMDKLFQGAGTNTFIYFYFYFILFLLLIVFFDQPKYSICEFFHDFIK